MKFQQLQQQLISDLKKSWQKSAILGVLLVIGLIVWLPPLFQDAGTDTAIPAASAVAVVDPSAADAAAEIESEAVVLGWQDIHAMVTSAERWTPEDVRVLESDPFELDRDRFPPPILFASETDDDPGSADRAASTTAQVVQQPTGFVLKSTVMSPTRRAAYINNKLYFEGMQIKDNQSLWRIAQIQPRQVVLTSGDARYELKMPSPGYLLPSNSRPQEFPNISPQQSN